MKGSTQHAPQTCPRSYTHMHWLIRFSTDSQQCRLPWRRRNVPNRHHAWHTRSARMHTDVNTAEYRKQKPTIIGWSWRQCSWIRAVRHANTDLPEQTQSWTELKTCCKPCMQHDVKPTSIRNLTANSCFRSSVPITILLSISCSWEGVNDHRQSSRIFWCLIRTRRSNQNIYLVQACIDNEIAEHHASCIKQSLLRHTLCCAEKLLVQKPSSDQRCSWWWKNSLLH